MINLKSRYVDDKLHDSLLDRFDFLLFRGPLFIFELLRLSFLRVVGIRPAKRSKTEPRHVVDAGLGGKHLYAIDDLCWTCNNIVFVYFDFTSASEDAATDGRFADTVISEEEGDVLVLQRRHILTLVNAFFEELEALLEDHLILLEYVFDWLRLINCCCWLHFVCVYRFY